MKFFFLVCALFVGLQLGFSSLAHAQDEDESTSDFRMTYDLSGSIGSQGGRSYSEIALGLNAYFAEWFVWRNSGFTRFGDGYDGLVGIDTSARLILNLGDARMGLTAFAGPGYRVVVNQSDTPGSGTQDSAPFAEGGVVAKLGGLSIGGGVKTVLNSFVRSGAPDDTQYFLILAGGGAL